MGELVRFPRASTSAYAGQNRCKIKITDVVAILRRIISNDDPGQSSASDSKVVNAFAFKAARDLDEYVNQKRTEK